MHDKDRDGLILRNAFGRVKQLLSSFLLLGLGAGATSCHTYSYRDVHDPAPGAVRLELGGSIRSEADRLAQPLVDKQKVRGIAVGVLTPDGATHFFGYGHSDTTDSPEPMQDTVFEVGSISKVFVATLVEMLVVEGRLSYDETVRSILPSSVALDESVGKVTVYELLTHTSGLPRQPSNRKQLQYFIRFLFTGQNLYGYIDKPYLYQYLRTYRVKPRDRHSYIYSNIGTALLGNLIETKTGRSIPELIEEKICRPLNLRDTTFLLTAEQRARLAPGHVGDQPKFVRRNTRMGDWDLGDLMRPAGGLYSTASDLLTLMQSNLGFLGHPLEPVFARTHRVQLKTEDHDVALGWDAAQFDQYHVSALYVCGLIGGYTSYIGLDEQRKIGVLVLCNTFNWHERVGQNLLLEMAGAMDAICGYHSALPPMRSPAELLAARTNYPAHWWTPIASKGAPSWEILPQEAKPGEVILSKRNELGLLSNFAATPFTFRGKRYASLEGFWQMMKYPESADDPRAKSAELPWTHTREQVAQMTAFEAKRAGDLGTENMKRLGITWLSFEGKRMEYRPATPGEHYRLIVAATREKIRQNPEVQRVLLATGDLILKPDHHQEVNAPAAWRYYEILTKIRAETQAGK